MGTQTRTVASAAVGVLMLLSTAPPARAQTMVPLHVGRVVSVAPGSIAGVVQDEKGKAIAAAVVSVFGPTAAVAVTDRSGKFEIGTLLPGPYLVRAHLSG